MSGLAFFIIQVFTCLEIGCHLLSYLVNYFSQILEEKCDWESQEKKRKDTNAHSCDQLSAKRGWSQRTYLNDSVAPGVMGVGNCLFKDKVLQPKNW